MGNTGSSSASRRRQRSHPAQPSPQPEITANRYVFAAATPYPAQYPNPNLPQYYQYPTYYQPPPLPMTGPYPQHYRGGGVYPPPAPMNWVNGQQHPYVPHPVTPFVEHQKAVTIRNDVNIKKESLKIEPDEENPGQFLVSFTFDATAPGSITFMFFAKENEDCNLTATKEGLKPVTVSFQQGLGQKFRQPCGSGIDFLKFEETELTKDGDIEVYPLVVKAEACPLTPNESEGNPARNSQITKAVFEKKDKGEYHVRVMKQILWVNGMRYELQEIYGIGNVVDGDVDENDSGKECVICLSEPRDTTVLPCRHMCMCSSCAKVLRFQTDRCPICRQPVDRLLEIKVSNGPDD